MEKQPEKREMKLKGERDRQIEKGKSQIAGDS